MKSAIWSMLMIAGLAVGCGKSATVEGEAGTKLTLTKPSAVTIQRGDMSKVDVKITRRDLPGDVTIRFANLPSGVDVVDSANRLVGDKGSYTLRAAENADLVENHMADMTATAASGLAVTQSFSITVKEKSKQ